MNKVSAILLLCTISLQGSAQMILPATTAHTSATDLNHYWQAVDSIKATADTALQLGYIHRLYIEPASEGLLAFMKNKDNADRRWLTGIQEQPGFWDSTRKQMPLVRKAIAMVEANIKHYQQLYPSLRSSTIYFLVGFRQQGGTIRNNLSLIGTEVVLRDPEMTADGLLFLCIHEYTHIQQKRPDFQKINVLTSSIREGACDFIAEKVTGKTSKGPYMAYGKAHEQEVWNLFVKDMYTRENDNWVSTGNNPQLLAPDLGYFVGYRICTAYYRQAKDKPQAIKDIIELDYADSAAVAHFCQQSKYMAQAPRE
ncbi:MAG: DUF2268 domain-containing putative Zn-dependent protease [Chitinophagaceae bacterium]